jgi:hypothetical protein
LLKEMANMANAWQTDAIAYGKPMDLHLHSNTGGQAVRKSGEPDRRGANRAAMPTVAALVDEYRALFPDLKVIHATENGLTVGKPSDESNAFRIPANYYPSFELPTKGRK